MSEQKHYEPNMYAIATSSKNKTCKRKTQSPPSSHIAPPLGK